MNKIKLLIKILVIIIGSIVLIKSCKSCGYESPRHRYKYSIWVPNGGGWYYTDSYKDVGGGTIEFTSHGGRIVRTNECSINEN